MQHRCLASFPAADKIGVRAGSPVVRVVDVLEERLVRLKRVCTWASIPEAALRGEKGRHGV